MERRRALASTTLALCLWGVAGPPVAAASVPGARSTSSTQPAATSATYTAPYTGVTVFGDDLPLPERCWPGNGCSSSGYANSSTGEARGSVHVDNPSGVFKTVPATPLSGSSWGQQAGGMFVQRHTVTTATRGLTVTAKVLLQSAGVSLQQVSTGGTPTFVHAGTEIWFHSTDFRLWSQRQSWNPPAAPPPDTWRLALLQPGSVALSGRQEVSVTATGSLPEGHSLPAGSQVEVLVKITSAVVHYPWANKAVAVRAEAQVAGTLRSLVVTPS